MSVDHEAFEQDLERDLATQLRIVRAIDLTHPAGAERRDDLVGTETNADSASTSAPPRCVFTDVKGPVQKERDRL
jgi:hypothetical protein